MKTRLLRRFRRNAEKRFTVEDNVFIDPRFPWKSVTFKTHEDAVGYHRKKYYEYMNIQIIQYIIFNGK